MTGPCEQDRAAADGPFSEHVRATHADPVLRRLMLLLTVAVVLGVLATAAAVVGAQQTRAASRADVVRAADLTRQLSEQQREAERRSYAVRTDTRVLLEAICGQIEAVAVQAALTVEACPPLPPVPLPDSAAPETPENTTGGG